MLLVADWAGDVRVLCVVFFCVLCSGSPGMGVFVLTGKFYHSPLPVHTLKG